MDGRAPYDSFGPLVPSDCQGKLREGLVSSGRIDEFTLDVFEYCTQSAIVSNSPESYMPSIRYLITILHPKLNVPLDKRQKARRWYLLHLVCVTQDYQEYLRELRQMRERDAMVDNIFRSIVHADWIAWNRHQRRSVGPERALIMRSLDRMTTDALSAIGTSYHSIDISYLGWMQDETLSSMLGEKGWSREGTRVAFRKQRSVPAR